MIEFDSLKSRDIALKLNRKMKDDSDCLISIMPSKFSLSNPSLVYPTSHQSNPSSSTHESSSMNQSSEPKKFNPYLQVEDEILSSDTAVKPREKKILLNK